MRASREIRLRSNVTTGPGGCRTLGRTGSRLVLVCLAVSAGVFTAGAGVSSADPVQDYPNVLKPATGTKPVLLSQSAQIVIEDGTALVADPDAADVVREAERITKLNSTLIRGRFPPTLSRVFGPTAAVGAAATIANEICDNVLESVQCWIFESDPGMGPVPTSWNVSPVLIEYLRQDGQDGMRQWSAAHGRSFNEFQPVFEDGYGGGSANWSGPAACLPDCYPEQLQGLGPLQFTTSKFFHDSWNGTTWWLEPHGPATAESFTTIEYDYIPGDENGFELLRMLYRPLSDIFNVT